MMTPGTRIYGNDIPQFNQMGCVLVMFEVNHWDAESCQVGLVRWTRR